MRDIKEDDKYSWLRSRPFLHRGFHNEHIKENTLVAFNEAVKRGFPFEFDVRLTRDQQVICFHDWSLKRMFNLDKRVDELSYEELNNIDPLFHFPLFTEVLELVDGKAGLMIEVKNDGKIGVLESKVIEILKGYKGNYAIVSFNPLSLNYFRINAPEIIRGQISSKFSDSKMSKLRKHLASKMRFNFISKPDFISYDINDFDENTIKNLKEKGYYIFGWTYRGSDNTEKLKELFDNVIFEDIEIERF